ncbi:MAG TPA: D-alanine--D-alanine ligase [Saprospiraceae bacterium]|nr:D-alanine--D-alanine ligase [Saprospiraceae bacterium]
MKEKLKIGVLFGGRSSEHNISLLSAKNVIETMDKEIFEPVMIAIDKDGVWHYNEGPMAIIHPDDARAIAIHNLDNPVIFSQNANEQTLYSTRSGKALMNIDVLFPVLHGTYGEDGSVQGFAKLANIPCVGCGILGSAAGMDKDITKRLLRDGGVPVAQFVTLRKGFNDELTYEEITRQLGYELFVKPANLGSSVGVSYVQNREEFEQAVTEGFEYDHKLVIEEKITGREIECAVLGNLNPQASLIGEVVQTGLGWYTFENKYVNAAGSRTDIPAQFSEEISDRARKMAVTTYRLLECEGLTRVDMFVKDDGEILVNEINTLPGFTAVSMYPKLWEATGIPYKALITRLIELAIESHRERNALRQ